MNNKEYIVLENNWLRFIDTIIEIVGIGALLFLNHKYLDGNGWLDAMFMFLVILIIATNQSTRTKRFNNKAELRKWLEE